MPDEPEAGPHEAGLKGITKIRDKIRIAMIPPPMQIF
jgi:hypothetical protein